MRTRKGLLVCLFILLLIIVISFFALGDERFENFLSFREDQKTDTRETINAGLDLESDEAGLATLSLELEDSVVLAGAELLFYQDTNLNILDFACVDEFECMGFEVVEEEVKLSLIVPLDYEGDFSDKVVLGDLRYEGVGDLNLCLENSFVTSADDSKVFLNDWSYSLE